MLVSSNVINVSLHAYVTVTVSLHETSHISIMYNSLLICYLYSSFWNTISNLYLTFGNMHNKIVTFLVSSLYNCFLYVSGCPLFALLSILVVAVPKSFKVLKKSSNFCSWIALWLLSKTFLYALRTSHQSKRILTRLALFTFYAIIFH